MSRFVSPVNPSIFPHLTTLLLGIGIFYTAWFFVYEVGGTVAVSVAAKCTYCDFWCLLS